MTSSSRSEIPVGTLLDGKFRITREIGRGGMAAVYEAEHLAIGKRVAVKVLSADLVASRVVRERFQREARATAAIRSPYICDVYDVGTHEERPFLVMELLEGQSLYELLAREHRLSIDRTLCIAVQTAKGLAKAHSAGVVHRDLKPENIFLTLMGDGTTVAKVLDFGLAKFYEPTGGDASQARLTRAGALFGTPAYMAPEQARGQGEVDHRCDLWALGCIVFECLTGRTVWAIDQGVASILAQIASSPLPVPSAICPELPPSFDAWFARTLARHPDDRFQDARALASALSEALDGTPLRNSDPPPRQSQPSGANSARLTPSPVEPPESVATDIAFPSPRAPSVAQRRARRLVVGVLGSAALLGSIGWGAWLLRPASRRSTPTGLNQMASLPAPASQRPLESEPFALRLGTAQRLLSEGSRERARALFIEAAGDGALVPGGLKTQAAVALGPQSSQCEVTGLGRPRPFDLRSNASRPSLLPTRSGVLVVWADSHFDQGSRQAFTVMVDNELRRIATARPVTPEMQAVNYPELVAAGDYIALLFWEGPESKATIYARLLDTEGAAVGPTRRLSDPSPHPVHPTLVAAEGSFWLVWEQRLSTQTDDLMARELAPDLQPLGPPIRLTAFGSDVGSVDRPHAVWYAGKLHVITALRKGPFGRLRWMTFDPERLRREQGLPLATIARPEDDAVAGASAPVGSQASLLGQPRAACAPEGCYIAWDDERPGFGAGLALIDAASGKPLWQKSLSSDGARPTVSVGFDKATLAWFSRNRTMMAPLGPKGPLEPLLAGRVTGFQPTPELIPGSKPGEWYLSWRDIEGGHLEFYVERIRCSDGQH